MADGNNGNSAIWVAVIGLLTTVAGGVFSQWEKIFPPPQDPATTLVAEPPAAGPGEAQTAEPAAEPEADAASEPAH